jgi:hypothetical protein
MVVPRNIFSVDLPDAGTLQRFDAFIAARGIKKGHAVRGALELFMILPAEVREWLIQGKIDEAKGWFDACNSAAAERMFVEAGRLARESKPRARGRHGPAKKAAGKG